MKKVLSARKTVVILIVMTTFQLAWFIWGGIEKSDYHLDELFSFGLSNSTKGAFLYDNFNSWVDGKTFRDYLTVQQGEGFSYGDVYYNQTQDVHPPVFYLLLHTICSFFPDTFSKWLGLFLNFVVFVFVQMTLYQVSLLLQKTRVKALLACAAWGFSLGAFNDILFIRMYALLTLSIMLMVFIHLKILKCDRFSIKLFLGLLFITAIGGLVHYYFLIFSFFLAVYCCLMLLIRKSYRYLIIYILTMLCSLAIIYLMFPSILSHPFSDRGIGVTSGFLHISFLSDKVRTIYQNAFMETIGIPAAVFFVVLAMTAFILHIIRRKNKTDPQEITSIIHMIATNIDFFGLDLAVIIYIWVIGNISPEMGNKIDRYIFAVFPLISINTVALMVAVLSRIRLKPRACLAAMIFVVILMIAGTHCYSSEYLYTNTDERSALNNVVVGTDCIYVVPADYSIHTIADALMLSDRIYTVMSRNQEYICDAVNTLNENDSNLLILTDWCSEEDKKSILTMINEKTDYDAVFRFKGLHGDDYFDVYELNKKE